MNLAMYILLLVFHPELSSDEMQMYNKMNALRKQHHLDSLPLNEKLCQVAKLHLQNVEDNIEKRKYKGVSPHSWFSDKQHRWVEDIVKGPSDGNVEDRPKEITGYSDKAYEIFCTSTEDIVPEEAVKGWYKSIGHRDEMLNEHSFKDIHYTNCGVGILKGRACIWFGTGK